MLLCTLVWTLLGAAEPAPTDDDGSTIVISARRGDDTAGDGSEGSPYRSITRALADVSEQNSPTHLDVDIGRYDAESGELFPLRLPSGTSLRGLTADRTVLDATGAACAIQLLAGHGDTHLTDLRIVGSDLGVAVAPRNDGLVTCTNVWLDGCQTGVRVEPPTTEAASRLIVRSSRFTSNGVAVHAGGAGEVSLKLVGCAIRGGNLGVWLEGAEGASALDHRIALQDTTFEECTEAGVRRTGEGTPGPTPIRVVDCTFRRNPLGIHFAVPSGDHPLHVSDSLFEHHGQFGIQLIGRDGPATRSSTIETSRFRWNGVGVQLFNSVLPVRLMRLHVHDNLGAAISLGSVFEQPSQVTVAHSLLVNNGAAGIFSLADRKQVVVHAIHNTIAFNHGAGIERRARRGGESSFTVRNCILAGNGTALRRIEPTELFHCLLDTAPDGFVPNETCVVAPPGFTDADARDFSLGAASKAKGLAGPVDDLETGSLDLQGRPVGGDAAGSGTLDAGALQSGNAARSDRR